MKKIIFIVISIFIFIVCSFGQTIKGEYPQNYFRAPVDFRMLLSGTFAELRSNHFHSGIDIKTGGVEGKNIYAVADGYISRIKVSPYGFGRALYVTHPNGYVSVYGHLQKFKSEVQSYVIDEQYIMQSYSVNLFPEKDKFVVKKGEVIALSGNTGGSSGPHLHFEIRDVSTQQPINPMFFGFDIKDWIRPKILAIKIYPYDSNSNINGKCDTIILYPEGWGPEYRLPGYDTLELSGLFSFGIVTHDLLNDASNKNGPYSIELYIDSVLEYSSYAESFSFDETRYINSYIDYAEFKMNKRRFVKTYIEPNNRLSIYGEVVNDGVFTFIDNYLHQVRYDVTDSKGNVSMLKFFIQSVEPHPENREYPTPDIEGPDFFYFDRGNSFQTNDLIVEIPKGALYSSFDFQYTKSSRPKGAYSDLHHIHNQYMPVHKYWDLSIKVTSDVKDIQDKLYIAKSNDGKYNAKGGEYNSGFVTAKIREFGDFCVKADTINPVIKAVNIYDGKNISKQNSIKLKISDKETGIKSYTGTLNGEWILMEYDAKNSLLIYRYDSMLLKGKNTFVLTIVDRKDNREVFEAVLVY